MLLVENNRSNLKKVYLIILDNLYAYKAVHYQSSKLPNSEKCGICPDMASGTGGTPHYAPY